MSYKGLVSLKYRGVLLPERPRKGPFCVAPGEAEI